MNITGVILAGGKSSRFGTDKASARYGHTSMLQSAVNILRELCTDIVISGRESADVQPKVSYLPDDVPGGGPMSGIATAVRSVNSHWLLILPCDMPLITTGILQALITRAEETHRTTLYRYADGRLQPLPLMLNRDDALEALPVIKASGGSIHSFLDRIPFTTKDIDEEGVVNFSNINTQSQLQALCHRQY